MTLKMDPKQRTQADRRKQTRNALLDATIEVLLSKGYDGSSLATVAKHAGLTTGSVQHHFHTKAQLMLAVVEERIFNADETANLSAPADATVADCCELLVTQQWKYYGNPQYLAFWAIVLGGQSDSEMMDDIVRWQKEAVVQHEKTIKRLFSRYHPKPSMVRSIQYFVNAQLRGLALLQAVENNPRTIGKQRKILVEMLETYISKQLEAG